MGRGCVPRTAWRPVPLAEQALRAYSACMQYTLRNVPKHLDRALRSQAKREHKSLNEVVIAALLRAVGIEGEAPVQRDLSDIVGTWQDDPELDRVLAAQRRIDPEMWK